MRYLLSLLVISLVSCLHVQAADSGWYLYIWSTSSNSDGEVGQFQTTGIDGVYVLEGVMTTESGQGMRCCAHLLVGSDPDRFYNRQAIDEFGEDADQL